MDITKRPLSHGWRLLALLALFAWPLQGALAASSEDEEIAIEEDGGEAPAIEEGGDAGTDGELVIDEGEAADEAPVAEAEEEAPPIAGAGGWRFGLDDVRVEYGQQLRSDSRAERLLYGKLAVALDGNLTPNWELKLSGRVDGYDQSGAADWSELRFDYGDSYLRYRGDGFRLTVGAGTVIWGRMDELPLSDRVSTADLTRFILDDLADRRRAAPLVRLETDLGEGRLDLVWLPDFRPAELPDPDSIWYPVDRARGRVLGVSPADLPPAAVQAATLDEHEPDGDGGFGLRYTASPFFGDIGLTIAHSRRSIPYYRLAGGTLRTEYPRSWAFGADTAIDAAGITWRAELVYSSDNPVTRRGGAYTTTEAVDWGLGMEMHPGDGDTRINLQLIGSNLVDPPAIIDRTQAYSFNGKIDVPFDRARWRASLDFYVGLDKRDLYLNPELTFLGWEPHELYLSAHFFSGDDDTLGGFHKEHDSINLGWRARF